MIKRLTLRNLEFRQSVKFCIFLNNLNKDIMFLLHFNEGNVMCRKQTAPDPVQIFIPDSFLYHCHMESSDHQPSQSFINLQQCEKLTKFKERAFVLVGF